MTTLVVCRSADPIDGFLLYGPFEDLAWAEAWIKQHDHNPYDGEEEPTQEVLDERDQDEDHWCPCGSGYHEVVTAVIPGFDPTTLPKTG